MGRAGPGRNCLLRLKIVWERTGNRNFRPTGKCFLNYQEIRTGALGQPHPAAVLQFPKETDGGSWSWGGEGAPNPESVRLSALLPALLVFSCK